jgi:hypothetical protein
MDTCAVTNAEFAAFVEPTGYRTVAERPLDPAIYPGAPPAVIQMQGCFKGRVKRSVLHRLQGYSVHSVPSWSNVAMRSSSATNALLDCSVVARTKSKIACFAGPSFHEASGLAAVWVCAAANCPTVTAVAAAAATVVVAPSSIERRLVSPTLANFTAHSPTDLHIAASGIGVAAGGGGRYPIAARVDGPHRVRYGTP